MDHRSECSSSCQKESYSSGLVQTGAKTVTTSGKTKRTSSLSLLQQLRTDKGLHKQVGDALSAIGAVEDESDEENLDVRYAKLGKLGRKSGLLSKPHDQIMNTVVWPRMKLGVWYSTTRGIDFGHLDLHLLVAGELKVVTTGEICERERRSRLNILKDLMCAAGFYEWSAVKRLFVLIVEKRYMVLF